MALSLADSITAAVRQQYELHPYPHYSLWLPMKWQEAYASTPLFAAQLMREKGLSPALDREPAPKIFMAGCGEIFPAVLARWEPSQHSLKGIDLSQRSIGRARLRLRFAGRAAQLYQGDLSLRQGMEAEEFAHIDAYGVLHHLPNPRAGLDHLSACLQPGGTLRLMVYNSEARSWIHHLQRAFQLLGLSGYDRRDTQEAQSLLELLAQHLPALAERLAPMQDSLRNRSRWVDTFLHEREARLGISEWLAAIESSGLVAIGLFDRYAELDDLPNPLYRMPSAEELETRSLDRRFENNLEIFCYKPSGEALKASAPLPIPWSIMRRTAPQSWRGYSETRDLSWLESWRLWHLFRQKVYRKLPPRAAGTQLDFLKASAVGRLSRIGALWPSLLRTTQQRELALRPLHPYMEAPQLPAARDILQIPGLQRKIEGILLSKGRSLRSLSPILRRFESAQKI